MMGESEPWLPNCVSFVRMAFSAICLSVIGSSLFATAFGQAVYTVGDMNGWNVVPSNRSFLNAWKSRYQFHVGDVLDFQYQQSDTVAVQVPEADYNNCTTHQAILTGTPFSMMMTLNSTGSFYVVDSSPEKCQAGLKLGLTVLASEPSAPGDSNKGVTAFTSKGALHFIISALIAIAAMGAFS